MSVVWITHDLALIAGLADRIAVLYAGTVVEEAPVDALFANPQHPYTRGLLASMPETIDERRRGETPAIHRRHAARARPPAAGLPLRAALPAERRSLSTSVPHFEPVQANAAHRVACFAVQ